MWSPPVTTDQVKTGDFIFCSTEGNTAEEAGILWNWISVKSLFKKKNFHSRFTSPSPHPALQRPLVFIKALNGACQQGSPSSSTLTPWGNSGIYWPNFPDKNIAFHLMDLSSMVSPFSC